MTRTYTTTEVQDIAVITYLKGMDYAAKFAKYQKAVGRIRAERMTLTLLNEQRHPSEKSFPRGVEGVPPHPRADVVASLTTMDLIAFTGVALVGGFVIGLYFFTGA